MRWPAYAIKTRYFLINPGKNLVKLEVHFPIVALEEVAAPLVFLFQRSSRSFQDAQMLIVVFLKFEEHFLHVDAQVR